MNITNIVKILYISLSSYYGVWTRKLFMSKTNMSTILPDFFPYDLWVVFYFRLKKLLGKSKNVSNKVPTRYNLLLERNAYQDHPSTPFPQKKRSLIKQ